MATITELPGAWRGEALLADPAAWTYLLSPADVAELDDPALALPTLGARAREWAEELRGGRGFVVVRGFPVERWSVDHAREAFAALGRRIGRLIRQNERGDVVADVRAERAAGDPGSRRYETNEDTPYHTDGSDVIALLCVRQGAAGGESSIVSSRTVVQEVARRQPDLAGLLFEPWHFAMTADATSHFSLPLVASLEPFSMFYIRWYVEHAQRQPDVPRLTSERIALLDLVDEITADPAVHLRIDFAPGDLQLLSNRTVMHARRPFVDHDDPALRRHLLRLWIEHHPADQAAGPPGMRRPADR